MAAESCATAAADFRDAWPEKIGGCDDERCRVCFASCQDFELGVNFLGCELSLRLRERCE